MLIPAKESEDVESKFWRLIYQIKEKHVILEDAKVYLKTIIVLDNIPEEGILLEFDLGDKKSDLSVEGILSFPENNEMEHCSEAEAPDIENSLKLLFDFSDKRSDSKQEINEESFYIGRSYGLSCGQLGNHAFLFDEDEESRADTREFYLDIIKHWDALWPIIEKEVTRITTEYNLGFTLKDLIEKAPKTLTRGDSQKWHLLFDTTEWGISAMEVNFKGKELDWAQPVF